MARANSGSFGLPVFHSIRDYRVACDEQRRQGNSVGLVPTLGALTPAHQALVRAARPRANYVVVSVFVNPTQFGPGEDYERYPRDLGGDCEKAAAAGASAVLAPDRSELYPELEATRVHVGRVTEHLCGRGRPDHFAGVATVVTKLLSATGPCVAVFGKKDYQQLRVIERLTRDLCLPAEILAHPLVRDADGLASSSRNRYLSPAERERALGIARALSAVAHAFDAGERDSELLQERLRAQLRAGGLEPEYADVMSTRDLQPASGAVGAGAAGAFVAARVGSTRLIDNLIFGEDPAPEVA